jgi:hypothetical protein
MAHVTALNARLGALATAVVAAASVGLGVGSTTQPAQKIQAAPPSAIYATDPDHIWNRINRLLNVRTAADGEQFGGDVVDLLLWSETRYLLSEPSHGQAIRLLDEFLESHGERLIRDPLRRAVFQHDLWTVFDWLEANPNVMPERRRVLMPRLARMMRRIALRRDEIDKLPDNYAAAVKARAFPDRFDDAHPDRAFLPRDLFDPAGSWVPIGGTQLVAAQHSGALSRSGFVVLWHLPGNARATRAYLGKLWASPQPYVIDRSASFDGEQRVMVNPALPAPSDGTCLALVRRMLLIDNHGLVAPSPLTESIQLRVLGRVQRFAEFRLRRGRLFAGAAGGLVALTASDKEYLTFSTQGTDVFEQTGGHQQPSVILETCRQCHQHLGPNASTIETIMSLPQLLQPHTLVDPQHPRWARWFSQMEIAAEQKAQRADWGMLQGLWQSTPW